MKSLIAFVLAVFSGMQGGQGRIGGKSLRRFGFPVISLGYGASMGWQWKYLAFLLFCPVLIMGYGVDSQLGAFCFHIEWLIRFVYAILLGIPFVVFGLWRWTIATSLLILAFQIHAGSAGNIGWFGDFLIEDAIRYSILFGLVIFNVRFNKK